MKSGTYKVSFMVDLSDCKTEEEAAKEVMGMVSEDIDNGDFPEVEFEMVEELDLEYNTDDEIEELEF
jgi:hypothetical protein